MLLQSITIGLIFLYCTLLTFIHFNLCTFLLHTPLPDLGLNHIDCCNIINACTFFTVQFLCSLDHSTYFVWRLSYFTLLLYNIGRYIFLLNSLGYFTSTFVLHCASFRLLYIFYFCTCLVYTFLSDVHPISCHNIMYAHQ